MEAIILAGGFGTRLKSVISEVPKPMAPIGERPFLFYILNNLYEAKVSKIILATGFKGEMIRNYFGDSFHGIEIAYSPESKPLGTGGALIKAMDQTSGEDLLVLNGDTFFNISFKNFLHKHNKFSSDFSLALKKINNSDRYGTVLLEGSKIVGFREKQKCFTGLINGGIYLIKRAVLRNNSFPETFSLERDFLEKKVSELNFHGFPGAGYFIDIGIPEDYKKAMAKLRKLPFK